MGPQRRLRIYVGYGSPSIIRYLEPLIGNIFTAWFTDCHFNETIFPALGERKEAVRKGNLMAYDSKYNVLCICKP